MSATARYSRIPMRLFVPGLNFRASSSASIIAAPDLQVDRKLRMTQDGLLTTDDAITLTPVYNPSPKTEPSMYEYFIGPNGSARMSQ